MNLNQTTCQTRLEKHVKLHRRNRLGIIFFIAVGLSVAIGFTLYSLSENTDLLVTPTSVAAGQLLLGQRTLTGGIV